MVNDRGHDAIELGHAARRGGRPDEALAHYRNAVALAPDSAEANGVCGLMLLQMDRVTEAAPHLERAVDLDPSLPAAHLNLAELRARQDDVPGAIRVVEALARETPDAWWLQDRLGELKARAQHFPEAAAHFRDAATRRPNDPALLYKWARATFDSGSPAQARAILDEAARLAPGHEAILRLYAEICAAGADWDGLARTAGAWSRAQPQHPLPWMFTATAQWETGYLAQAMQSYREFLARGGSSATNLATYGRLCLAALAYDEAARALDEAERQDPGCAHMLSAKATLAMFGGRFDDALAYARRALAADPRDTAAFRVLVQVSGGRIAPDELAQLERLAESPEAKPEARIPALYALADCFDAQGDADAAFAAYGQANELGARRAHDQRLGYDRAERRRQTDWLMASFPAAAPATAAGTAAVPIFIVGMPRSGTTLVESIVGAHSRVVACGERQAMRSIMQEFVASSSGRGMRDVAESTRQRWREAFWRELPDLSGALAVTDKNPWNFDALGVILELFPQARVIHVRRNPVETGLSIFRNDFPKFASFAHRLDDIGHFYGEYARLMAHWQDVLRDRFMTLQYEDLVADIGTAAPELLRFCGLEWQDACRDFASSQRIIGTLSAFQARQPVGGFRGRSARYARHLAPLIGALRDAGVDLQTGAYKKNGEPKLAV